MAEKNVIRVAIVDDHALVHEAIGSLIEDTEDLVLVGSAPTAARGVQLIRAVKPNVAVIDISLPDMNGLLLAQKLVREFPAVNIVVLSMYEDLGYVRQALDAGAKAYVSKRSQTTHLLQAIHAAAGGGIYIDPAVAPRLLAGQGKSGDVFGAEPLGTNLTERELGVVRLIALGHTAKEVAGQLGVTVKSVETYKARACEKLHVKTRSQLVRYAAIQGWLTQV
jgi:DNA-binding NarL/FixJ family response regulator